MKSRMLSVLGWIRRLGGFGEPAAQPRKSLALVPSIFDSLERREVLSTATFAPFVSLPTQVLPGVTPVSVVTATPAATSVISAVPAAVSPVSVAPPATTTTTVGSPTSIAVASSAATPSYYYGKPVVQPPAAVQASAVAPVYYTGQPVVAASASGISATNMDTDYVQALYRDVLDRVGTPNEVATWVSEMGAGMTIPQVAQSFINSPEHRQDEVDSYYQEFLHRTPDAVAQDWIDALESGASEEAVVEGILDMPEYQTAHQSADQLIQGLYTDVLGRQVDPAGYAQWSAALASGESRAEVVANFVNSAEAIDQVIENFYTDYLHREPDLAGSAQWASILESPNGSASDVAVGILSSTEFVQDSQ